MNTDRWLRVRDLFEKAIEQPTVNLESWLASEAPDDPEVVQEVRSLVEHHTRVGEFMAQPVAPRATHLFDEETSLEAGASVGSYTIIREIGRGGMGRVFLARDQRLGRTVALKALSPLLTRDPSQRERLRREARAAAALSHPGICTVYALEEINGDVFIASEFIDGHSLREEISPAAKPAADRLLADARQLANALASAHAKGITHRDLKPENVMRGPDGRLEILDFGLALVDPAVSEFSDSPRITQPGAVLGTPAYMSPEQLNGRPADPRTDIFALGVLLYEYATGVHPFEAGSALALAARVLEGQPRPLSELRPDLPAAALNAIHQSLRKNPADRVQSAAEFEAALGQGITETHPPGVTRWWRTHQVVAIGLYFIASALSWQIKEWQHGYADASFLITGIAATVVAVFRGHLLFTERMNRRSFEAERQRAEPVTLVVDGLIGVVLATTGWSITATRAVAGVLTIALGVGIALTRIVVEPATTRGAFGE